MKYRKCFGIILATLFTFLLMGNVSVYAENDDGKNGNSTVTVSYVYEKDNVSYEISKTGGVLIGDSESGVNQVISCLDNVVLSDEERNNLCAACSIPAEDADKINPVIKVSLNDVELEFVATEMTRSEELNLVVLNLSQSINASDYAVFNLDDDAYTKKQDLILYDMQGVKYDGQLGNKVEVNSDSYLEYLLTQDVYSDGCGIYNKNGEFLGLCQKDNPVGGNVALSGESIAGILDHINVNYSVADHNDYSVKTQKLEGMLEVWEAQDLSVYTKGTRTVMEEAIANAKTVLENEEHTQEEVDAAVETLEEAQKGLSKKLLQTQGLVFMIIAIVFFVATLVLTIYLIVDKKKRKRMEIEKEELEKKRAPKNHEPYKPNSVNAEDYVPGINLSGFAPSSKKIEMNHEDTNVLQNVVERLIFVNDQKRYQLEINTFPAVIGKDRKQSNYAIANSMISRKHLSVYHNNGRYQIVDLNSKNGSFLNGKRLTPSTGYDIHAGDELILADERYRVYIQ